MFIQDIEMMIELNGSLPTKYAMMLVQLAQSDTDYYKKIVERAKDMGLNHKDRLDSVRGLIENAMAYRPWEEDEA